MQTPEDKAYFADTTAISNSQLKNFISYNKYGQRLLTPDKYLALHVDKSVEFQVTDAIIIGKIVDKYFDGTGEKTWENYIPVARRTGKEIKALIDKKIKEEIKKIEKDLAEKNPENAPNAIVGVDLSEEETKKLTERITKEVNDQHMEITMTMKADADQMIAWGKAFRKFKKFLQMPGTEAQVQLREKISLTHSETGEIVEAELKGKPDYINKDTKLIVDLKTTGSMSMIVEDLQFKGEPKLTAGYIRQLSIYNKLMGGGYAGALALVTATGVKWIDISNEILEEAWTLIEQDIILLKKFLDNPDSIDESIFVPGEFDDLNL